MKIFFLLATIYSSTLFAKPTCEEAKIKIIFDKKPIITSEILCLRKTAENMVFYISETCAQGECEVLNREKKILEIKDYTSTVGSPGFKLCTELGGVPQIFEYSTKKDKGKWQSTERCLFGAKDFVEISLLVREWKSFINLK